jgi:hypothetical protein
VIRQDAFVGMLISLLPNAMTYQAWRLQKIGSPKPRARMFVFRAGLAFSVISSLTVALSWLNPFPPSRTLDGGYSNTRNFWLATAALGAALVTILLAAFGRGGSRLWLAASGLLLTTAAYGAFLASGV